MAGRIILGIANPALDSNGEVDSTATLTFYENGTTTLQSVYTAEDLLTPLANPLPCDAAGRFPQVWAPDGDIYSVKWAPTGASPITYDDIAPCVATIAGQIVGTNTSDNAAAGAVGEIQSASLNNAGGLALTTSVGKTILTLALTPGDWDVNGEVWFDGGTSTNTTFLRAGVSLITNTVPSNGGTDSNRINYGPSGLVPFATDLISINAGPTRVSISANTNVYLTAQAAFTVSTMKAYGTIRARRVR